MPAFPTQTSSAARLVSRLKLRHLALLIHIAERESLTRVAEEMGISQPAATKALGEIEAVFGAQLFLRTPRGLRPTPLGERAIVRARHMLQDVDRWVDEMEAVRGGHSAHLHVGAVPYISARVLVPLVERLYERHRITISLQRATTDQLLDRLRAHELDCVIGRAAVMKGMDELQHEVLYPQRPALITNRRLAQAMARRAPDWAALAEMNWILPSPLTPIGNMVTELFARAGARPPAPMIETYSMDVIAALMAHHDSLLSIVPEEIATDLSRDGNITIVPWTFDWTLPPVSLIRRRREFTLQAEESLIGILREVCAEAAGQAGGSPQTVSD